MVSGAARASSPDDRRRRHSGKILVCDTLRTGGYKRQGVNLQQLRYVHEVARHGLNISAAAAALHTSQPGVSKQIRAFEAELGVGIFVRSGRRLVAVTDAGQEVLSHVDRILANIANLRAVGEEFAHHSKGTLTVAVTHTQA